ncbi:MAG: integron integrase [Caldilineales bacterium]|nr:integron integrase [Caldilineales bacterium]
MSQFLDEVRTTIRRHGLADSTEKTYVSWIKRCILFQKYQNRDEMTRSPRQDIERFLNYLANDLDLSASSVNQALGAIIFLYKSVLRVDMPYLDIPRQKSVKALQHPLDDAEARELLSHLHGQDFLLAAIMYGAGLRVNEVCSLRIKDFDFAHCKILVTDAKGGDHRLTMLPKQIVAPLQAHLTLVKKRHDQDLQRGHGYVWLPPALRRKYPQAEQEWQWQYAFPSRQLSRHRREPENMTLYRFYVSPNSISRSIKIAAQASGIDKRVTPHILRHSFAVSMRKRGYSIEQIQALMGHKSAKTTQYHYLRSIEPDIEGIRGPLD